jgi:hypothetical protein
MQINFRIFILVITKQIINFEQNKHLMTQIESLVSAEEEIKPYLSDFRECYQSAIEKYNDWLDSFAAPAYNRTRAIIFQNIIVNEIKERFFEMPNVRITEKYESISLIINDHISARFKKLNKKGFPSNHRSRRNDSIIAQQMEITFAEYPPIARIDVGYNFDSAGMNFNMLKIMCRKDDDIIWDLYFNESDESRNEGVLSEINPIEPDNILIQRVQVKEKQKKAK